MPWCIAQGHFACRVCARRTMHAHSGQSVLRRADSYGSSCRIHAPRRTLDGCEAWRWEAHVVGNGLAIRWQLVGNGLAMDRQCGGNGFAIGWQLVVVDGSAMGWQLVGNWLAMGWPWDGHGLAMGWQWTGNVSATGCRVGRYWQDVVNWVAMGWQILARCC